MSAPPDVVIFDFDGTLIDSDEPLLVPFDRLGVDRSEVIMGSAVAEECERLGIDLDDYVSNYDTTVAQAFPGVDSMLTEIPRWAIVSNKHPDSAAKELNRLGWKPEATMCADAFDWKHKSLIPMVQHLGLCAEQVVLVGDSGGDLLCAEELGCRFIWAGWNERVRQLQPEGETALTPSALLTLIQ